MMSGNDTDIDNNPLFTFYVVLFGDFTNVNALMS